MGEHSVKEEFKQSMELAEHISDLCDGKELFTILFALVEMTTDVLIEMEQTKHDKQPCPVEMFAKMTSQILAVKRGRHDSTLH